MREPVSLAAIASLDEEIARERQQCEDELQRACAKLKDTRSAGFHDCFLESLRSMFDTFVAERLTAGGSTYWSRSELQAFAGRYFVAYHDASRLDSLWDALKREGVKTDDGCVAITCFEELKGALRRDTDSRLIVHDVHALVHAQPLSQEAVYDSRHSGGGVHAELEVPRLSLPSKRRRSEQPKVARDSPDRPRSSLHSCGLALSSDGFIRGVSPAATFDDYEFDLPVNGTLLTDMNCEVIKKSQNWLGRWRTRYMFLRWNELEMCKKNVSQRHSIANSFPSQSSTPSNLRSDASASLQGSSHQTRSKRYSLQNLLSIQIVPLNESDPVKRHALDLHFRQIANGTNGGHTTKSLIIGLETGIEKLKKVMSQIATLALFSGIIANEKSQTLMKFVEAGANLDAFGVVPGICTTRPVCPVQLAFLQGAVSDTTSATVKMLIRANADRRSMLHLGFATRFLFADNLSCDEERKVETLVKDSFYEAVLPLQECANDGHGWTLLMYFCLKGQVKNVEKLLDHVARSEHADAAMRYVAHTNASGDNSLHIAIKASVDRQDRVPGEDIAILLARFRAKLNHRFNSSSTDEPESELGSVLFMHDSQGNPSLHLGLKARMWRLVDTLLGDHFVDFGARDSYGNNTLHVAIKVGAPQRILTLIAGQFKQRRTVSGHGVGEDHRTTWADCDIDEIVGSSQDTALTLALKNRLEPLVKLLLEAGANPNCMNCNWDNESTTACEADLAESPLSVAIRTGLAFAAMALVEHGAKVITDGCESSPLALAIRYGMYTLANTIGVTIRSAESACTIEVWIDTMTGTPVVTIAVKAGQLELASLLADMCGNQVVSLRDIETNESFLHTLVRHAVSITADVAESNHTCNRTDGWSEHSPPKPARIRPKSRNDEDLHTVARSLLPELDENVDKGPSSQTVESLYFFMTAIGELVAEALRQVDDHSMGTSSVRSGHLEQVSEQKSRLLMTRRDGTVLESAPDVCTLLHVAALGKADCCHKIMALMLAYVRLWVPPKSAASLLNTPAGLSGETALHRAISSGSEKTALLLLHELLRNYDGNCNRLPNDAEAKSLALVSTGTTVLHLACRSPRSPKMLIIVDLMLGIGMYSCSWNDEGMTPLHVAIQRQCDARLIQVFKKYDQDLNVWSEARDIGDLGISMTPLMMAIQFENPSGFRELVRCGADIRIVTPQSRLGLLQLAARRKIATAELIDALLSEPSLKGLGVTSASGMTSAEAIAILKDQRTQLPSGPRAPEQTDYPHQPTGNPVEEVVVNDRVGVLPIKLLAGPAPSSRLNRGNADSLDDDESSMKSNSWRLSRSQTPCVSPAMSPTASDSLRGRQRLVHPGPDTPRERSMERILQRLPKPPALDDLTVEYLREEERATLTLVAQEARSEAQEWLKKRSGHKKLLSEARAQLQSIQSHRRTNSGTVILDGSTVAGHRRTQSGALDVPPTHRRTPSGDLNSIQSHRRNESGNFNQDISGPTTHRRTPSGAIIVDMPEIPGHRRSGSGSEILAADPLGTVEKLVGFGIVSQDSIEEDDVMDPANEADLLERYKALAAKKFVDKHVAEAVAEARMEIEREKQVVFQDTGIYPGGLHLSHRSDNSPAGSAASGTSRNNMLARTASMNSSMMLASSRSNDLSESGDSGGTGSVWWSDRGGSGSFFGDDNSTWLSTGGRNGTFVSDVGTTSARGDTFSSSHLVSHLRETESGAHSVIEEGDHPQDEAQSMYSEDAAGVVNPLDRESFVHVIEERKTLS